MMGQLSTDLMAQYQRRRRRRNRRKGVCTECKRPPVSGKKKCAGCLAYQRGWYHENYGRPRQRRAS